MPEAAVILPVYQGDKPEYLSQALESTYSQTYRDFDLIITLDGTIGPELSEVLSSVEDREGTIILSREEREGLAANLNHAVEYVLDRPYRYIARMDSDDIMEENRLKLQLEYLEQNPGVDAVGSGATLIDQSGIPMGTRKAVAEVGFKDLLWSSPMIHPSMVFRREFFERTGLYDPGLLKSQDYDLWFRAIGNGRILRNLPMPLIRFRISGDLIKRRKEEQGYNLRIKRKYLRGIRLIISVLPNLLIVLMPSRLLGYLVRKGMYRQKKGS